MKKKKMIIIVIMTLVGIVLTVVFSQHLVLYVNSNNAKDYLAEKYDVDKSEIEYLDGRLPTTIRHADGTLTGCPEKVNMSLKFKMNDREFFVQKINNDFYDDYQIYDIEELSTKWLQENIDEYIAGISLDSKIIYEFQMISQNNHILCLSLDNICDFLEFYFSQNEIKPIITIVDSSTTNNEKTVFEKIQNTFSINQEINIYNGEKGVNIYITNKKNGNWRIEFV